MFQTKVVEEIKAHILYSVPFFSENRDVHEIMWKGIVDRDRPQMTVACWNTKATNTHSQYVILTSSPLQHWLQERPAMLRLYILCLSCRLSLQNCMTNQY